MRPDAPSAQASFGASLGFMLRLAPCADPRPATAVTAEAVSRLLALDRLRLDKVFSRQTPQATL